MNQSVVKKIQVEFERRKAINSSYSLRGYAKHMGVSVSLLSRIINGKMPMTLKLLQRMSLPLSLTPLEYEFYEGEISSRKTLQSSERIWNSSHRQLELDEFHIIQDSYNFAILELVNLQDFQPDEKWISKKINISEVDALHALERLVRLELLIQTDDGTYRKSANFVSIISNEFTTVAMKNRQKQVLQKAIDVLDLVDISQRDQSAITLSLDSDLLPEIKNKIKIMRRSLANYITKNSKKRDRVYEISISFFPWSE